MRRKKHTKRGIKKIFSLFKIKQLSKYNTYSLLLLVNHMKFTSITTKDIDFIITKYPNTRKMEIIKKIEAMEQFRSSLPFSTKKGDNKCVLLLPAPMNQQK